MINFDDAVVAANVPASLTHAVYYVDGRYANGTAIKARFPHAKLLGITVFGATKFPDAYIIDCENGDATPAQAEAWVANRLKAGVYRPCVYASLSTWDGGLLANLAHYKSSIRRWVADWNNVASVPAGYDAKQFINDIGGADRNVALDTFFDTSAPKPKPKPTPAPTPTPVPPKPVPAVNTGKVRFAGSLDLSQDKFTIYRLVSTGKREIAETYRATIEIDVAPDAPDVLHIHRKLN